MAFIYRYCTYDEHKRSEMHDAHNEKDKYNSKNRIYYYIILLYFAAVRALKCKERV